MITQHLGELSVLDNETSERIAQIMSRWTASTPGEWITTADNPGSVYYGEVVAVHNQDDPDYGTMSHVLTVPELDDRPNDLIFAAEAHQDIPFLVAVISELSGRYTTLRKHVDYLNDVHDKGQAYSAQRIGEMMSEIVALRTEAEDLRTHIWPRDAKIVALQKAVAGAQQDVAELLTTVEQQRQYIESLKTQVGELLAWKHAVPVAPIERYICDGYGDDDATSDGDWKTILAWLDECEAKQ